MTSVNSLVGCKKARKTFKRSEIPRVIRRGYTYVILPQLRKVGIISRKELVTLIHIPLYDGRHFGPFQVDWTSRMINGQTLKKELSSIFRSPHPHISLSISFPFSFSHPSACLSLPHFCPVKDARGHQKTAKNKNAEGRIDRFIVGYHLQSAPDKFWIPLTIRKFSLSFSSHSFPVVFH